ncbi:hypothetical protein N657DRAFT_475538 [Parathielavia appendiculata]|uniref:Uncharacterized protein n=1 Tax=Parathielavia appendiculata TaxID=2587402 RepID=A0AAN6TZQ5_9PEZI|nr:hypothetical protein N657DRAFT_475538 [Parathielavia appendiculata]
MRQSGKENEPSAPVTESRELQVSDLHHALARDGTYVPARLPLRLKPLLHSLQYTPRRYRHLPHDKRRTTYNTLGGLCINEARPVDLSLPPPYRPTCPPLLSCVYLSGHFWFSPRSRESRPKETFPVQAVVDPIPSQPSSELVSSSRPSPHRTTASRLHPPVGVFVGEVTLRRLPHRRFRDTTARLLLTLATACRHMLWDTLEARHW